MGLALHPQFATQPWVYVMYSVQGVEGGPYDRVSRYREAAGGGSGPEEIIVDSLPTTSAYGNNRGGSIAFGPDGMLYIAVGDYYQPNLTGDPSSKIGKILRVTPDGNVPADNPIPNSPVWASGFRNPRGLTWHQQTRQLFVADNGNARGDPVHFPDRIVAVQKGAFHGWGTAPAGATTVQPFVTFDRPAPPGDLMFYKGDLYMTVLGFNSIGAQSLIKVTVNDPTNPTAAASVETWFADEAGKSTYGRLRAMAIGPDGALYVGTSSHDGRTMDRRNGDDQVIKITTQ
jgi:quinoprotein glucose dehydrogenase